MIPRVPGTDRSHYVFEVSERQTDCSLNYSTVVVECAWRHSRNFVRTCTIAHAGLSLLRKFRSIAPRVFEAPEISLYLAKPQKNGFGGVCLAAIL